MSIVHRFRPASRAPGATAPTRRFFTAERMTRVVVAMALAAGCGDTYPKPVENTVPDAVMPEPAGQPATVG